jgi:peptidoglycan hydrolase-like amidase
VIALTIACLCVLAISTPFVHSGHAEAQSTTKTSVGDVSVGVLGLFHSREFVVHALSGHALVVHAGDTTEVLESSLGTASATIELANDGLLVTAGTRVRGASEILVTGRQGEVVEFRLAIPGKISRRYRGRLEITPSGRELIAVVRMDREAAVAAVVAAESLPDTPIEALKAQAVAARSYFAVGVGRHLDFDFCDTTHCQFLREVPASGSRADEAVAATRGLALAYNAQPFPAMYTRSCSGHTLAPPDVGMRDTSYPYYSADCLYCREHPSRWTRSLSARDAAALRISDEASRVQIGRHLGWDAVPSNTFVAAREGDQILLRGVGQGHGIGLCQAGARAMALRGANWQQILSHYYPNTTIISLPTS